MSLVGLSLIARNEQESLPVLLESINGAFDRVVLLDTGSIDGTRKVFVDWAMDEQSRNDDFTFDFAEFEWIDDFSAARNAADLLLGDDVKWRSWADCDDIIVGAQDIRKLLSNVPDQVYSLFAHYDYYQDPRSGRCICQLNRERFIRTGLGMKWIGRVHEATEITGGSRQNIPAGVLFWKHQKNMEATATESVSRNIMILERWYQDEPTNSRVVGYLGTEYHSSGNRQLAIRFYNEYLALEPDWIEERGQIYRKLGRALIEEGEFERARRTAQKAMDLTPAWPDAYLTLAEANLALGKNDQAIFWAKAALDIGQPPETMLIINPVEYEYMPRKVIAGAYANKGDFIRAMAAGNDALHLLPDEHLQNAMHQWQTESKLQNTAKTFCDMATQLIAHDEQAKALILLEQCVPHFAYDHPHVAQTRSMLRKRLAWVSDPDAFAEHYENGGSKPEDFIADDQIDSLCDALPRTAFLLENLSDYIQSDIKKELAA